MHGKLLCRTAVLFAIALTALSPVTSYAADFSPVSTSGTADLVPIHLPEGVALSLPGNWLLLTDPRRNRLQSDLSKGANAAGERPIAESSGILLAAIAGSGPTNASLTISTLASAPGAAALARREAKEHPEKVSQLNEEHLRNGLTAIGATVTRFDGTKLESFDGKDALVTRYEMVKPGETQIRTVRVISVITEHQQIVISQSFSNASGSEGASLVDTIRDTIKITKE